MQFHQVTTRIIDLLKENGVWFETFEHEPVRTSEEAAAVRTGYALAEGAKAMIVRIKRSSSDKRFVMLVVPGNLRFDTNKVRRLFDAKDVRFATEEEVAEITDGVQPGGIPPFGSLFGLEIIVDQSLFNREKIVFNAGDRRFSIGMRSADYEKIIRPRIERIV